MLSSSLRKKVLQFIDSTIEIEELEDWYVARLPLLLADPNSSDSDLVSLIELGLSELSAGIRDENNLRYSLRQALQQETIFEEISIADKSDPQGNEFWVAASTSATTVFSMDYRNEPEGIIFLDLVSS